MLLILAFILLGSVGNILGNENFTFVIDSSARLRWEYTGGSELFVVYSDGRDTRNAGWPGLLNRTLAIEVTRLVRF